MRRGLALWPPARGHGPLVLSGLALSGLALSGLALSKLALSKLAQLRTAQIRLNWAVTQPVPAR
jgi:hypothetical protein